MKRLEEENFMLAPRGSCTQHYIKTELRREWVKFQLYVIYDTSSRQQQAAQQNSRRFDVSLPGYDEESFDFRFSEATTSTDDSQMTNAASWRGIWRHVAISVTIVLGK